MATHFDAETARFAFEFECMRMRSFASKTGDFESWFGDALELADLPMVAEFRARLQEALLSGLDVARPEWYECRRVERFSPTRRDFPIMELIVMRDRDPLGAIHRVTPSKATFNPLGAAAIGMGIIDRIQNIPHPTLTMAVLAAGALSFFYERLDPVLDDACKLALIAMIKLGIEHGRDYFSDEEVHTAASAIAATDSRYVPQSQEKIAESLRKLAARTIVAERRPREVGGGDRAWHMRDRVKLF